jgi:hypothetical protein
VTVFANVKQGAPPSLSIPCSLIREVEKIKTGLARQKTLHKQLDAQAFSASQKLPSHALHAGKLLAHDESSFILRTRPTYFHWLVQYGGQYKLEYQLVAPNADMCAWWVEGIGSAIEYQAALPPDTPWKMFRKSVKMSYDRHAKEPYFTRERAVKEPCIALPPRNRLTPLPPAQRHVPDIRCPVYLCKFHCAGRGEPGAPSTWLANSAGLTKP